MEQVSRDALDSQVIARLANQTIALTDGAQESRGPAAMLFRLILAQAISDKAEEFRIEIRDGPVENEPDVRALFPNRHCRLMFLTPEGAREYPPPPSMLYFALRNLVINATGMPKFAPDSVTGYFRTSISEEAVWQVTASDGWAAIHFKRIEMV